MMPELNRRTSAFFLLDSIFSRVLVLTPSPDKPEELIVNRYWLLVSDRIRLSMHVCGYEARIGIRKLITVKEDRDRIKIDILWYRSHLPSRLP